ncbi:MAG: glycosyltransferase family 4 protein [Saprospiraceae bacterium]
MTLLFVVEHYYPYIGGAETLFQSLAESLAAAGKTVTVVTTRFRPDLAAEEDYRGVRIIRINCGNRFLFSLLALPRVIREARRADLIHTTTYNAAPPAWLAGKLTRKKVILTFHEVWGRLWFQLPYTSWWQRYGFYLYEQAVVRLPFHHYIAVSEFTRSALIRNGIPAGRISRIYNGLVYERFTPYPRQAPLTFTYTYFGRLGISKGLDLLLPAAALLSKDHPESCLVLIIPRTPKPMYRRITRQVAELGLTDRVFLRHELNRDELYRQIAGSSCVVVPSYSEGFCFVAAETVALGVPIVSSGRGALPETVSGDYLQMEDMTADSLYRCLVRAYNGNFNRRPVRRFPLREALESYLKLYGSLL